MPNVAERKGGAIIFVLYYPTQQTGGLFVTVFELANKLT